MMFRFVTKGQVDYLEAKELAGVEFLTHAFCTRHAGVSSGGFASLNVGDTVGDLEENIVENLNLIRGALAIPENGLVMARQVHGDRIIEIGKNDPLPTSLPECDGFVTERPGVALAIRTADCVPVLFVDRRFKIVGAVHAGWRGTALGIAAKMVDIFRDRFSSRSEDIMALIGPAIGPCCYEVDAPVVEAFATRSQTEGVFRKRAHEERWMADLGLANRLQLMDKAIPRDNILTVAACTSCRRDLFFSHRAAQGQKEGRQLSVVMIN